MMPTNTLSNIPIQKTGTNNPFQGASMRIDAIFTEIMTVEETSLQDKVALYEKLLRECVPYMTPEDETECRKVMNDINQQLCNFWDKKPNHFSWAISEFDSTLRRFIKENISKNTE